MNDEDIKLPKIDDAILSDSSGLWLSILEWYKATVVKPSLSWELEASRVDEEVKKLMTEYAREAVRLNPPIATNDQPLPFDLEAAKRGEAIVTRDGRKARFLAHEPSFKDVYQLIIKVEDESAPMFYQSRGSLITNYESEYDLFMAPKPKRVVYLNIYPDSSSAVVHASESSARKIASPSCEIIAHPVELP